MNGPRDNGALSTGSDLQNLATVRSALEHIEQGITVFDAELRLVALNQRFLQLLEMPTELGEPGTDFAEFMRYNAKRGEYGEGETEDLVANRVDQARKFEAHSFERVRPDGTILQVSGTPLPEGGFVSVYTDVTKERRREAALESRVQARTEELRRNQARLSLIANEVPAGIALLDTQFEFKYTNRRFAEPYGLTPESILNKKAQDILSPANMETVLPRFHKAVAGEPTEFEIEVELPDDKIFHVRNYLRPEISDTGRVTGFYILTVNITRQKEADLALARAQKMEALGTLSAGIAHDFNNLLTIILGNLHPLRGALTDEGLRRVYLDPAIAAASRGNDLTTRLLSLTKQKKSIARPLRVTDAISDALQILTSSLTSDIRLTGPGQDCTTWVNVDRGQLEMALINLAVNGSEAIEGPGRITIDCDETVLDMDAALPLKLDPGRYCRIAVRDTGHGMSEEVQQRVFDPFYSRKPGKGSGLGLAMVYAFVDQSGGAISLRSQVGGGSEFILFLPAIDPPTETVQPRPIIPATDLLSDKRVLLVEDNDLVRDVVRRQLTKMGADVVEAASAEEAMDKLIAGEDVALVLSDVSMTGEMTGVDLRGKIGTQWPGLPVILMTAYGAQEIDETDGPAGLVLQKPFRKQMLEEAIAHVLSMDGS